MGEWVWLSLLLSSLNALVFYVPAVTLVTFFLMLRWPQLSNSLPSLPGTSPPSYLLPLPPSGLLWELLACMVGSEGVTVLGGHLFCVWS